MFKRTKRVRKIIKAIHIAVAASFAFHVVAFAESGHDSHGGNSHDGDHNGGHSGAHWSYEGSAGPERWGSLGYPQCEGKNQSPVDISKSAEVVMDQIEFRYSSSTIDMINNGHTVQFNYAPGSSIKVGGVSYELVQFHFHAPSENTVSGKTFPMEMHLVHKSKEGKLAVVGVFFKSGGRSGENDSIDAVFRTMANRAAHGRGSIDAIDLLPHDRGYYHFMGSLTTPPCSEGVAWFVMREPIEVMRDQLATFQSIYDNNARPPQPWNNRIVYNGTAGAGH
jgi:carbonic anhydrase